MTPREKLIMALEGKQPPGRVPHFELVFYLTMEVFGKLHPEHRSYHQWDQMEEKERQLHRQDIADLYIAIAQRYEHSAIFLYPEPKGELTEIFHLVDLIREKTGDKYALFLQGDCTHGIPSGDKMVEFSCQLADDPEGLKQKSADFMKWRLERAEKVREHGGVDGYILCSDYCFNSGPFMSPAQFSEFVTPYLAKVIAGYRDMGFYVIKHTDGNIMPIIDQLVEANPNALHSLDPQAGVDIAEVKRLYGDKLCLIGNVCCATMQSGSEEDVIESARYALKHGMPGGGYIFSTSNGVYTGMPLKRYELMLDVWRKEGNYDKTAEAG